MIQQAATNEGYCILSSHKQKRSLRVSQGAATNVSGCIPDTHSHKVSALDDDIFYLFLQKQKIALGHIPFGYSPSLYLLPKVKISRTLENLLPLMVSAIVEGGR